MREVYFETENVTLRFYYDEVIEGLPYYESTLDTTEPTTLRDLLSRSDQSIRVPKEQYRFAYLALDLIQQGKGVVYCKACKRYYEAKLKRVIVGHGESPFSANVKRGRMAERAFRKETETTSFGRQGVSVPRGA